jgi:hypothetical protein
MLKVIKYNNANTIEATWFDAKGNQLQSIAYADVQMQLFRDDVAKYGGNITEWESLITQVEANIQPIPADIILPIIPTKVSMYQAREALRQTNLLATVDAAITNGTEADKLKWEYAIEVNREDLLVKNLANSLQLSTTDLDNLFKLASTL